MVGIVAAMISRARWGGALWGAGSSVLVLGVGMAVAAGCSGDKDSGVANAKMPGGSRSESIAHEACDEGGNRVESLDANGDGKADIKRIYDKGGHELCRITDLNHDGKPDMYEYYDASGQLRRRESDFDDSGVVDLIEFYENGKLVRKELDTTGQHRIDTWDYFDPATGKRTKRERDTSNDGRVDQWWAYDGDKITIQMDKNGDGVPEPESTVVIGGTADAKDGGATATGADDASAAPPAPVAPPPRADLDAGPTPSPGSTPQDAGPPKRRETRGGKK
jgi:hypothetical protein